MITEGQCAHFKTFGFLMLKQAFSAEEMEAITRVYDQLIDANDTQPPDNEKQVKNVAPFIEKSPQLAKLAEDDRIYGTMEKLLGAGFIWGGSEGQDGRASADWHADRPGVDELFSRGSRFTSTSMPPLKLPVHCALFPDPTACHCMNFL